MYFYQPFPGASTRPPANVGSQTSGLRATLSNWYQMLTALIWQVISFFFGSVDRKRQVGFRGNPDFRTVQPCFPVPASSPENGPANEDIGLRASMGHVAKCHHPMSPTIAVLIVLCLQQRIWCDHVAGTSSKYGGDEVCLCHFQHVPKRSRSRLFSPILLDHSFQKVPSHS